MVYKKICISTKCENVSRKDGIKCSACLLTYHYVCVKLTLRAFELYRNNNILKWVCANCIVPRKGEMSSVEKKQENINKVTRIIPLQEKPEITIPLGPSIVAEAKPHTDEIISNIGDTTIEMRETTTVPAKRSTKIATPGYKLTKRAKVSKPIKVVKKSESISSGIPGTRANDEDICKVLKEIKDHIKSQSRAIEEIKQKGVEVVDRVRSLETDTDIALGRQRNVVISGIPEPYKKGRRIREDDVRHHLTNILRMADIPGHVAIKRVHRLGMWREGSIAPRRLVVEFANPRHRDHFLSAAETVKRKTQGSIHIMPDDRSNRYVDQSPSVRTVNYPSPCLKIHKINEAGGKLLGSPKSIVGTQGGRDIAVDRSNNTTALQCSSTPLANGKGDCRNLVRTSLAKPLSKSTTEVSKNGVVPQV